MFPMLNVDDDHITKLVRQSVLLFTILWTVRSSVIRLGDIWKLLVAIFSCKSSPNISDILGYFEKYGFWNKLLWLLLIIFGLLLIAQFELPPDKPN